MFDKILIIFFSFYLISKFFTETIKVMPKIIDIIDLPIVALLIFSLMFKKRKDITRQFKEDRFIYVCVSIFSFTSLLALLFNYDTIYIPAVILYFFGFLGGPVLYFSIEKFTSNKESLLKNIEYMIYSLMVINIVIVVFINIPEFLFTGNPDVISGSFGNNQYVFSFFVVLIGMYFLGISYKKNKKVIFVIFTQAIVFLVYYLLQYRAGLPFFVFSYTVIIYYLYKIRSIAVFIIASIALLITLLIGSQLVEKSKTGTLEYDTWLVVLNDPFKFLNYSKFTSYPATMKMFADEPISIFIGVGPGNYLSRAHYTFAWDFVASYNRKKGVGPIIEEYFGRINARYSPYYIKYILPLESGYVLGSAQFSNTNSSILSPLAESGIIGGSAILILYILCFFKSLKFLLLAKEKFNDALPLAVALAGSSIYLIGLTFLDNYLEMLRVTLFYWLLYWAVSIKIEKSLEAEEEQLKSLNDIS